MSKINPQKLEEVITKALTEQWYDIHSDLPLSWVHELTKDKTYRDIPDRAKKIAEDILTLE